MLQIDLYVDQQLATTYNCDGLIISTPVGSTAHNLSAGGPILRKTLQAFVISPISPHTLTMRPFVDTADRIFELKLRHPHPTASVVVDGRVACPIDPALTVRIQRAASSFQLISVPGQNDYKTLREKLGWSGSPSGHVEHL
jgi:NAD+ kinase